MKKIIKFALVIFGIIVIINVAKYNNPPQGDATSVRPELLPPPTTGKSGEWAPYSANPILSVTKPPAGLAKSVSDKAFVQLWNDPSVIKEGGGYSMWAALSTTGGPKGVEVYKLTSDDGLNWTVANGGLSVLKPGAKGQSADWYGVETPAVVKAGGTYHMYYTIYKDGNYPIASTAHATSPDGINWTKKGELTSITSMVGNPGGNPWGWLARAEPAITYVNGTFYLYLTDVKCRIEGCKGSPKAYRGISLFTSKDGHSFTQTGSQPVLLQTASYPASQNWEGYSTPWVYHNGQTFELYVDVWKSIGDQSNQTTFAHYRSNDGINFTEIDTNFINEKSQSWAGQSVRAPSVIEDGGKVKMWYAGDALIPGNSDADDIKSGKQQVGIGYAEKTL